MLNTKPIKTINSNTSKMVGKNKVRIPWKIQIGTMNGAHSILILLIQGAPLYGLNLFFITFVSLGF